MKRTAAVIRLIIFAFFGAFFLVFDKKRKKKSITPLTNTQWQFIKSVSASTGKSITYPAANEPYRIVFNSTNRFSTPYNCNYATGKYKQGTKKITFSNIRPATKKYCQSLTEWENLVVLNLFAARRYTVEDDILVISNEDCKLYFHRLG